MVAIQSAWPVGKSKILGATDAHKSTSPLTFVRQDLISKVFSPDIIKASQGCFIEIAFMVIYY